MSDLYVNIYDYEDDDYPIQFFTGGRGTGKTYGALSEVENRKLILMRRTQEELDLLGDVRGQETGNPFKTLNTNNGWNYGLQPINPKVYGIYQREIVDEKLVPVGAPRGLAVAMSTVSKVRGMDFSDYSDLIYDEFIPERHIRRMKGESDAFLNAYETINRNREFDGLPALKAWLLSNANDIYNPIFVGLGIVSEVERMMRKGKQHLYLKDRGLAIHLLKSTEKFKEQKQKTTIAKLTKGTNYYEMAYENKFAYNDFSNVGYRNVIGMIPVCSVDKAFIYRKKGAKEFYISYAPARVPKFRSNNESDVMRFKQEFGIWLVPIYVAGTMYFESYELKELILKLIL